MNEVPDTAPAKRQWRRALKHVNGEERSQLNVQIPVENHEWLKNYAQRKGMSMAVAVTYAIFMLYEAEKEGVEGV